MTGLEGRLSPRSTNILPFRAGLFVDRIWKEITQSVTIVTGMPMATDCVFKWTSPLDHLSKLILGVFALKKF